MRLSRADRRVLIALAGVVLAAILVWRTPRAVLGHASGLAVLCLQSPLVDAVTARRCQDAEATFVRLSKVPWTRHDATYRYEELRARRAMIDYQEATAGTPDLEARTRAASILTGHQDIVEEGSQRIALEELGLPVGAPHAGKAAVARGDRATLLDRWDHVGLWSVRVHAMRAAMMEGDLARLDAIAARYAEFDPRDADLRTAVGAALCLGPDPGRGLQLLARVAGDRAAKRSAGMARNFGAERAVQEACADLASIEPPELPLDRDAGIADAVEVRAVQALRLARGELELKEARAEARALLLGDAGPVGPGLSPTVPHARASLMAELIVADPTLDAASAIQLARRRETSEPSLAPEGPVGATWLLRDRAEAPFVPAFTFERAASRLEELKQAPAAAALQLHATAVLARAGREAEAEASARRTASLAGWPTPRAEAWLASVRAVAAGRLDGPDAPSGDQPPAEERIEARLWDLVRGRAPGSSSVPLDQWAGFADPVARWRSVETDRALASLDPLAAATMPADPAARRQARLTFLRRRGDAPDALVPWTLLVARLAPPDADTGAHEVWLDTALAIDAPRFTLREVAFARAAAARARGDEATAATWDTRLRTLRAVLDDPRKAVIARFLGF
jgi:hypothetical protein